jgi:hypothetical protein
MTSTHLLFALLLGPALATIACAPPEPQIPCPRASAAGTPPQQWEGGPALIPPGVDTALTSVRVRCQVTYRGRALRCQPTTAIPEALAGSIQATLRTWRFQAGTYDGQRAPMEHEFDVPLVAAPPGVTVELLPEDTGKELRDPGVVGPRMVRPGPPAPFQALQATCDTGRALLACMIAATGSVEECDVLEGPARWAPVLLEYVESARYVPATKGGLPVRGRIVLAFVVRPAT